MAISKSGELYTWGVGAYGRLGLGYLEDSTEIPNQTFPFKVPQVFDNSSVLSAGCGMLISGVAMLSGSFYTWGRGQHERAKMTDHIEFSSPKMILEQKSIVHASFGVHHVMLIDRNSCLYGFGEGTKGCLGLGDGKKRFQPL
jgi:alpha-tubulin suppressor-like RCC1 family protein